MTTMCTGYKPDTDNEPCGSEACGKKLMVAGSLVDADLCQSHLDAAEMVMRKAAPNLDIRQVDGAVIVKPAEIDPLDVIPEPIQRWLIEMDRKLEETDLTRVAPEGTPSSKQLTEAAVAYVKVYKRTGSQIDDYMLAMRRYAEGKGLQPRAVKGILNVARAGLQRRVKQKLIDAGKDIRPTVFPGRYAVVDPDDGVLKFYRIRVNKPTQGEWAGRTFVDLFVFASDEQHRIQAREYRDRIIKVIGQNPQAAAQRYTDEIGKCSECGATLTDEYSRSIGRGPICDGKFGMKVAW